MLVTLNACTNRLKEAQDKADFLTANGASPQEICDQYRVIQKLQAEARDPSAYRIAKLSADIRCSPVRLDPDYENGGIAPDNLMALPDTIPD